MRVSRFKAPYNINEGRRCAASAAQAECPSRHPKRHGAHRNFASKAHHPVGVGDSPWPDCPTPSSEVLPIPPLTARSGLGLFTTRFAYTIIRVRTFHKQQQQYNVVVLVQRSKDREVDREVTDLLKFKPEPC